jgi:hypothetical protein
MKKPPRMTKNGTIDRRRPPEYKRYPKGVSGNPLGRPRSRVTSLLEHADQIIDAPVAVIEDGNRKLLTECQIRAKRLANQFVRGELKACKEIVRILKRGKKGTPAFSEIEMIVDPSLD